MIEDFGDILKTTYPLTYSCYYGALEINSTFWGYVNTFTNPLNILINILLYLGDFYDTIYYLVKYMKYPKSTIKT